jgi:hypothetical protein
MKLNEEYAIENEKLIALVDYLVYCIMTCDVKVVRNDSADAYATWTFRIGEGFYMTFDKKDVDAVRIAYNAKDEFMLPSERNAYERFFDMCV